MTSDGELSDTPTALGLPYSQIKVEKRGGSYVTTFLTQFRYRRTLSVRKLDESVAIIMESVNDFSETIQCRCCQQWSSQPIAEQDQSVTGVSFSRQTADLSLLLIVGQSVCVCVSLSLYRCLSVVERLPNVFRRLQHFLPKQTPSNLKIRCITGIYKADRLILTQFFVKKYPEYRDLHSGSVSRLAWRPQHQTDHPLLLFYNSSTVHQ